MLKAVPIKCQRRLCSLMGQVGGGVVLPGLPAFLAAPQSARTAAARLDQCRNPVATSSSSRVETPGPEVTARDDERRVCCRMMKPGVPSLIWQPRYACVTSSSLVCTAKESHADIHSCACAHIRLICAVMCPAGGRGRLDLPSWLEEHAQFPRVLGPEAWQTTASRATGHCMRSVLVASRPRFTSN